MKFLRSNKAALITAILTLLFTLFYLIIKVLPPSGIIQKLFGINFNDTARVDGVFYKYFFLLGILCVAVLFLLWFKQSIYVEPFTGKAKKFLVSISRIFNVKTLLGISLLYLAVLFAAAVYYYDLGFDEAWYITFARNFSLKFIPFYTANERIAVIDTISMLPYYLFSLINYKIGLLEVWHFKLMSVLFSAFTLFVLYKVTVRLYGYAVSVLFVFLVIVQPGFGFIASSYFGEFLQAAFMFYGLYYWLKNNDNVTNKTLIVTSLLFTAAIHTKFQLVIIIALVLLVMSLTDKNKQPFKLLLYTILFTILLSAFRTIPVLITSPGSVKGLAIITDLLAARSTTSSASMIFERLQLFNRFFPLAALIAVSGLFCFQLKNAFERFILFFTLVTSFWWIFIYPLSTYRNPFMAIITLCLMAAIMLSRLYESFYKKYPAKSALMRYVSGFCIILLMLYGFSANLIYARIGYNDGVQFDLDGFASRLFNPIVHDNTQKDFHGELKRIISPVDTLYNGSFVARFYVPNTIFTFDKLSESLNNSPAGSEKLLLVTRDVYPLGFENIYMKIDSIVNANKLSKRLILKTGRNELYGLKK